MSYLDFFHFDNHPFPYNENFNYFFPRKCCLKAVSEISKLCRFYSGIYIISGNPKVGKTVILQKIISIINNNDIVISAVANEKTEILKVIATKLNITSKDISDILLKLSELYSNGQNIIITIDNSENLSKEEYTSLSSLLNVIPSLRVILCGDKSLYKKLNEKSVKQIKKRIVKKFKIPRLSIFGTMRYISFIEREALALSQYKRVFSKLSIFAIALLTNRNIMNVNFFTTKVLETSWNKNKNKVSLKSVYITAKENFDLIKENIYIKFQKLFFYIVIILSFYFAIKISIDRYDLINDIEAIKSIRAKEKELGKI